MATKKGLCPYCITHRVERRIFPVNPEASTCFCPTCMKEVEPKVAIDGYTELISKMLLKADNTLFVTCDPVLAYSQYAEVIELEPKEAHALLGRILCLIYMGKVRKSYLPEAYTLLENTTYEGCDIEEFIFFLKKINFALDEYESCVQKKLVFKTYFFDVECLKLFWMYLHEIIKMKELILSIIKDIKKDHKSSQSEIMANMLEHNIDEKKRILHADTYICDGAAYRYVKTLNDKVIIDNSPKKKIDTHLNRYRLSSLSEDEKHKRYIKDEIFKDYTKIVKSQKVAVVFTIIFYLLMCGCGAAIYPFMNNKIIFYSLIGAGGLFLILGTILLILSVSWKLTLKKRRLRID